MLLKDMHVDFFKKQLAEVSLSVVKGQTKNVIFKDLLSTVMDVVEEDWCFFL